MLRFLLLHLGREFLQQSGATRLLDPKLGLRLLRDRRVPGSAKLCALALGLLSVFILEVLEIPLQTALALLLPVLGVALDFAVDGVEIVAVPMLVASLVLPFVAPRSLVEQVRRELHPQAEPTPAPTPRDFGVGHTYDANGTTIR